jgi:hypothetical protein
MAHFAKISENNEVLDVVTLNNQLLLNEAGIETELLGQQYLYKNNNWPVNLWVQTSYNTKSNQHKLGGTPFRGNYAEVGGMWDPINNIFWPIQPFISWNKDILTASWKAPIFYPTVTTYLENNLSYLYAIHWNDSLYQENNTKGWQATKETDFNENQTVYNWNGSDWIS